MATIKENLKVKKGMICLHKNSFKIHRFFRTGSQDVENLLNEYDPKQSMDRAIYDGAVLLRCGNCEFEEMVFYKSADYKMFDQALHADASFTLNYKQCVSCSNN